MKKLFALITMSIVSLFCGVVLTACGNASSYTISITSNNNLVEFIVADTTNETEFSKDLNGKYTVPADGNISVHIMSSEYGVDMSNLHVTVNNSQRQVFSTGTYDTIKEENSHFGWFTLPMKQLRSNLNISVSGATKMHSSFSFASEENDSDTLDKISHAYINTSVTGGSFVSLSSLIQSNDSYSRPFDGSEENNTYRTFKLKFNFDGKDVPDAYGLEGFKLFTVKSGTTQREISSITYDASEECYIVDLGELNGATSYTISTNFSGLQFKQYSISQPAESSVYKVEVNKSTLTYSDNDGAIITVTKKLLDSPDKVDYTNMVVKANSQVLEKIENNSLPENQVQFKIPAKLTPMTSGGSEVILLNVDGLDIKAEMYEIGVNSVEESTLFETPFIVPNINTLNSRQELDQMASIGPDGAKYAFENDTVVVTWNYSHLFDGESYWCGYDLYDYDINYDEGIKILNLKEEISGKSSTFTTTKSGFTLTAIWDGEMFNSFKLTFECKERTIIYFNNFQSRRMNVRIGYDFEDSRVTAVSYSITQEGELQWYTLIRGQDSQLGVCAGDYITFRLALNNADNFVAEEFTIRDSNLLLDGPVVSNTYRIEDVTYVELQFQINNLYYGESENSLAVRDFILTRA